MTVTQMRLFSARMALVAIVMACVIPARAATFDLVDSEGFEAPLNTTTFLGDGRLEGQLSRTIDGGSTDPWQASFGTTSTAFVQNTVYAPGGGTQAVRVERAPGSFDRWGVPIDIISPVLPYVVISWDMMIPTQTITGVNGPVFGSEAYDGVGGTALLSFLGVDIATREVVIQDPGFTATGAFVNYDEWNNFRVILDHANGTYSYELNGTSLGTTAFVDAGGVIGQLFDVTISALGGAGDAASMAATGIAYFDNFIAFETDNPSQVIPEPSTVILVGLGIAAIAFRKRAA